MPDTDKLEAHVKRIIEQHPSSIEASVWFGPDQGEPWYTLNPDHLLPVASAIKVAYLVELFDAYADALDRTLPGIDAAIRDDSHPAIKHFSDEAKHDIRRELTGATVWRIGRVMIHGPGVSNAIYNAAANVTTAVLGGPERVTVRIKARDPAFDGFAVRRYMMADRKENGDNEACAAMLAAVMQRIASGQLRGVKPETLDAIREALYLDTDERFGKHYFKSGSLSSDPAVQILSGYYNRDGRNLVYIIMLTQRDRGDTTPEKTSEHLKDTANKLRQALLDSVTK